jgi:hypothetical protein
MTKQPESKPPSNGESKSSPTHPADRQGLAGWAPALVAMAMLLIGMMILGCVGITIYLFQNRGVLAARTLRGELVPAMEQSQLQPEDKKEVLRLLNEVIQKIESQQMDNDQVSGLMQRLLRLGPLEWSDCQAVQALIQQRSWPEQEKADAIQSISRALRALESDKAMGQDLEQMLASVQVPADNPYGRKLNLNPSDEALRDVATRAKSIGDAHQIPMKTFEIRFADMTRRAIENAIDQGAM